MKQETKFIIGIAIATILIVVGGVFFFSKNQTPPPQQNVNTQDLTAGATNTKGDQSAPVTVVEFADLQCPACRAAHPIVKNILEEHGQDIYYVWRHFPLSVHRNARAAAQAAEAAGKQGKFWEMQDMLFTNQEDWSNLGNPKDKFKEYAQNLGLDTEKYDQDFENAVTAINHDVQMAQDLSVASTPTFFINGTRYEGVINQSQFNSIIEGITSSGS